MTNMGWLFSGTDVPLELTEVDEPVPGEDEVVIDVAAAGLCHTDVGIIEGTGAGWITKLPIVLGHEVAGTIRELGPDVDGFAIGDRVAIGLLAHGATRKRTHSAPGVSRNGGYQQRTIAEVAELVPLPDNVTVAEGAAATDSATTAYHAVMCAGGVGGGMVIGVVGMGGLGLNAVQIALAAGAEVHGVDINEGARERADQFGATSTHEAVEELAKFHPEIIFDFAGFGATTTAALKAVRPGGTVVLVGLGKIEATVDTQDMAMFNRRLQGSSGGSKEDLERVLQMISEGTLASTIEEIPFDQLPQGIRRLTDGDVVGRLVLHVADA